MPEPTSARRNISGSPFTRRLFYRIIYAKTIEGGDPMPADLTVLPRDWDPRTWFALSSAGFGKVSQLTDGDTREAHERVESNARTRSRGRRARPLVELRFGGPEGDPADATVKDWTTDTERFCLAVLGPESLPVGSYLVTASARVRYHFAAVPINARRVSWQAVLAAYLAGWPELRGPTYARLRRSYILTVGRRYQLDEPTPDQEIAAARRRARDAEAEAAAAQALFDQAREAAVQLRRHNLGQAGLIKRRADEYKMGREAAFAAGRDAVLRELAWTIRRAENTVLDEWWHDARQALATLSEERRGDPESS